MKPDSKAFFELMERCFPDHKAQEAKNRQCYADGWLDALHAITDMIGERLDWRDTIEVCFAHHEKLMDWAHNRPLLDIDFPPTIDAETFAAGIETAARTRRQIGAALSAAADSRRRRQKGAAG